MSEVGRGGAASVTTVADVERARSDAIWQAYLDSTPREREVLDGMIASLRATARKRSRKAVIGPRTALEVIAALGWMLNGVDPVTLEG